MATSQLRNLVYYHLDNDLSDTANFLAGRLSALDPRNPDSAHLLALTYLRLRRYKAAHDTSQKYGSNGRHLGCAYVFAQACLQLKRYAEGVGALDKAKNLWHGKSNWNKHTETSRRHIPDAAAVQTLLGKLYHAHGDEKQAAECYASSHRANPFIWESFEGLCKIGSDLNIQNMFQPTTEMNTVADTASMTSAVVMSNTATGMVTPFHDPFNTSTTAEQGNHFMLPRPKGKFQDNRRQPTPEWDTPTGFGVVSSSNDDLMALDDELSSDVPSVLARKNRHGPHLEASEISVLPDQPTRKTSVQGLKRTISGHATQALDAPGADPPSNPRRSNRLFGLGGSKPAKSIESAVSVSTRSERETRPARTATGTKGRTGTTVGRVVSGNRKMLPPPDQPEKERLKRAPSRTSEKSTTNMSNQPPQMTSLAVKQSTTSLNQLEQTALYDLLSSFRKLAIGYYAASRFELPLAITTFRSLPAAQRESPWVLAQLGKAYYEMAEYKSAEECFARLIKVQPYRSEDLEVYSTVLWHLKKDTSLALLSHNARDQHYEMPQTWCVIGNAFSLAREHDHAISCFKRATQLDESFAYAWTLMGHEYISNEEYDAALYAFRRSVTADRRGFGGWYGLGKSLEKMGKYEDAERHFRIASSINPSNATLLVCIGVVLEKLRDRKAALAQYAKALQIVPTSALARFRKAKVLLNLKQYDQALIDLELLRDQAPDEANVWFLLGKCYKGMGERGDALRAFTAALNLDVKASQFIREAMESLDEDVDDEDDESDDG